MPRKKSEITTTENNQLSVFDYSKLAPETAKLAKESAIEIKAREKAIWENIIEIGNRLIEVKNVLDHGSFQSWCDSEFEWDKRTAQRYMKISEEVKTTHVSLLSSEIKMRPLYALASGLANADEETKEEIFEQVEEETENQGRPLTEAEIKAIIKEATDKAYKSLGNLKNYLRGLDSLDDLSPNELATKYELELDIVNTAIEEIKTEKENQTLKQLKETLENQKDQLESAKVATDSDLKKLNAELQTYKDKEESFKQARIEFDDNVKKKAEELVKIKTNELAEQKKALEDKIKEQKALNDQLKAQQKQLKNTTDWLKRIESFNASLNTKVVNIVSTVKDIQDPPNFEELGQEQREVIFPYFSSVMNEFEKNSEAWGKAINNIYFALKKADQQVVNLINAPIDVEVKNDEPS